MLKDVLRLSDVDEKFLEKLRETDKVDLIEIWGKLALKCLMPTFNSI